MAINGAQTGMTVAAGLLFGVLFLLNLVFFWSWYQCRRTYQGRTRPLLIEIPVGVVVSFFDTLGIGSFAPTTAVLKFQRTLADELIPGTLNVGLNSAALLETIIMVTGIAVDPLLLTATVTSAAVGAWLGAGVVSRLSRSAIQLAMGIALLTAGCVFAAANLHWLPGGGMEMTLSGWRFVVAIVANFVFGALMSVGIGLYAPCMIVVTLLGLHPLGAFPIMMAACALVQPTAGLHFIRTGRFGFGTSIALLIGSIPGVLLAAFVVKQLPLVILRWLVLGVVVYAALSMLESFWKSMAVAPAG